MALFFVIYSCEMKTYQRILIFLILHVFKNTRSQYLDNVDVISAINLQPTPVSEPSRETDVATVLLVDNNDRASHGRFLNVKPSVGLITSTARTFIQEGITTEYATQLVGTTLDNGRLYAQLLSKSTRVLYDNNDNRKSAYINEVLPQHNNWRFDDDLLLQSTRLFIKNTDDYGQSNPAFLVYPSQSIFNKIPVYQAYTNSGEASINTTNTINEHDKILQGPPVAQIVKVNKIINPDKVQAKNTLPTFTVTNEFANSRISYNGQTNKYNNYGGGLKQVSLEKLSRSGKNVVQPENGIIHIQHLPEVKNLTSITYYGFADFTTVVGDTVIIFSPSTINSFQNTHITSIIGEATLNDHEMITAATFNNIEIKPTSINFSNEDINNRIKTETHEIYNVQSNFILEGEHDDTDYDMITIEVPETTTIEQQQKIDTPTQGVEASTQGVEAGKEMEEGNEEYDEKGAEAETVEGHSNDIIKEKPSQEAIATTPFMSLEMEEKNVEKVPEQINAPDTMIEPSEKQTLSTPMLSTPSNDDISKIFASLASAKVQQELEKSQLSELTKEIDPKPHETQVLGGVTTIFFEDDPFAQFEQPNQMESNTTRQEKQQDYEPKNTTEHTPDETTIELEAETTIGDDETTTITEEYIEEDSTILTTTDSTTDPIPTARNPQEVLKPCEGPLKLIPSIVYKTLTFLTTYFIPVEDSNGIDSVSTSVKTDRMETSDISYNLPTDCYYDMINPTNIQLLSDQVVTTLNNQTSKQLVYSEDNQTTTTTSANGMLMSIETSTSSLTENKEKTNVEVSRDDEDFEETTTEIAPTTTEKNEDANFDNNEIELIYKTLYTTYTYLTTFFHDSTSSISSRKEVVTNIVSSTLNSLLLKTDDAVANLVSGMSNSQIHDIKPTAVTFNSDGSATITNNFIINENDLAGIDNIIHDKDKIDRPTPVLTDIAEKTNIRTYYTTYTYFTTIFVDGETEISSRTEVYTNYVNVEPTKHDVDNNLVPKYSTMMRNAARINQNEGYHEADEIIRMITDVKSSSSNGDRSYIEEELDDQLSSESNREETIPEPSLLLLQTSYTTFTFFTTMYIGSTSSNILSRLETVTNVVTEKIKPTEIIDLMNTASNDNIELPITYFTTFTYWTTLFKDNRTITTSREETISNVLEPTSALQAHIATSQITQILETTKPNINIETSQEMHYIEPNNQYLDLAETIGINIDPTTYYTTYTYFTTSYIGDETILNSRFETFTNIITPNSSSNVTQGEARAIKTNSGINNQILESTMIKPSKPLVNVTEVTKKFESEHPSIELVSINYGKIIDADGVSTLYYTTKAFGTLINNELSQIIESTSSLNIDEQKKSLLAENTSQNNETMAVPGNKNHKTGLVRSIDGTIIANRTTTLYQSKIIGTNIDGRYAQIIVSTTSLLIEKTPSPMQGINVNIKPTEVIDNSDNVTPSTILARTPTIIEPSTEIDGDIDNSFEDESDDNIDDDEDEDDDEDGTNRKKSRLTFQTRKRTFTPVIRPFASRNRPTFNPKRKNVNPTAATIISRLDFTPTITATPALKNDLPLRGRFSVNRNSNRNNPSTIQQTADPGQSGNRRFVRPRVTTTGNNNNISPLSGSYNSGNGGSTRLRSSVSGNRIQPTPTANFGGSSRRGGFRGSSSIQQNRQLIGGSSIYSGSTRFNRIRPSSANQLDGSTLNTGLPTGNTTSNPSYSDDDLLTTLSTEDPTDFTNDDPNNFDIPTTETLRRNQNPLLRFRRPKIGGGTPNNSPTGFSTTTTRPLISTRKSALLGRNRNINKVSSTTSSTSTTSRPRVNNLFQRPTNLIGLQNRNRTTNSLFPARGTTNRQPVQNKEDDLQNGDNIFGEDENNENDQDTVDTYYDASDEDEVTEQATTDIPKARTKRQVEYGTRSTNFNTRFRRPTTSRNKVAEEVVDDKNIEEPPTPKLKSPSNRYSLSGRSRSQGNSNQAAVTPRIRPTSTSNTNSRSQFTLREKDVSLPTKSSNFRRPTTSTRRKPTSVTTTRPKNNINNNSNSRLRGYSSTEPIARAPNSRARTTASSRGRANNAAVNNFSRARPRAGQQDFDVSYVQPSFDGTIVITHHIPTEVTIPVINGRNTEYKNIVTAKISTETIGPQQYSTSIRENGVSVLVLANDVTGVNANGATEITQFFLNETPTTSIIFTPTTIRGRKTSYSHIIPSTIFDVDRVVTTIQPQIAANAPLANILLSQLLLGNLNQNINPLLALQQQQQQQQQIPVTPTTELKTKTTTYVTTVTNSVSTILPLTFRGKEILTTIVDTSVEVITATEFITETVVVQPTLQPQNQQLNSLLLPLLLQQQQQQQVQPQSQQQIRKQTSPQQSLLDVLSFEGNNNKFEQPAKESEEYLEQDFNSNFSPNNNNNNNHNEHRQLETSVITLYVSGRRPGEFSTILSTVVNDLTLRKRSIEPSRRPSMNNFYDYDHNNDRSINNEEDINSMILASSESIANHDYNTKNTEILDDLQIKTTQNHFLD